MDINDMDAPALRRLVRTVSHELLEATNQIEALQHSNNELQSEVARLHVRREVSSGDLATQLVGHLYAERAEAAALRDRDARYLTIDMSADFRIPGKRCAYIVSVREEPA